MNILKLFCLSLAIVIIALIVQTVIQWQEFPSDFKPDYNGMRVSVRKRVQLPIVVVIVVVVATNHHDSLLNFSFQKQTATLSTLERRAMLELNLLRPKGHRFSPKDTPCVWGGVLCQRGHVTHISWWMSNLTGTIGSSIEHLNHLQSL
jgi:hypothetical protein